MQTDLRLVLLIIGFIIVTGVIVDAWRRHQKYAKRARFDETFAENPHQDQDPLLDESDAVVGLPAELISVGLTAPQGMPFPGAALSAAFKACDLVWGDKKMFYRLDTKGKVSFSVVSMVEPGTFEPHVVTHRPLPGIMLFMTLPSAAEALGAFNDMLETLGRLNHYLGGDVSDDKGHLLTGQTAALYRERVQEFERQRLLHKRAR